MMLAATAQAQLSISDSGAAYTIDFQGFTAAGFQPTPTAGQLDSDMWAVTGWSDGNLAFGGTRVGASDYARGTSTGGVGTGGIYAFTGGTIGAGAALGFQPGGSDWAPGTITLRIQNNTASTITGFSLAYEIYARNDQGRANSFNFSHSANDVSYIAEPSLNFVSVEFPETIPNFVLNNRSITLSGLSMAPGAFYYLRWNGADVSGSGSRDEFALDDIVLGSFTTDAVARMLTWNPAAGPGGAAWNTTSAHWLESGSPTAFATGDIVNFTDAGLANGSVVQIASGVAPTGVNVQNTTGTYRFQGGPIAGAGGLNKTGNGGLVLEGANTFTGTVTLAGGALEISANDQLGANANDLSFGGGKLIVANDTVLDTGRQLTGAGAIQVNAGKTLTVNGDAALSGLVLSGPGAVNLAGANRTAGPITFEEAGTLGGTGAIVATNITSTQTSGTATITAALDLGATTRTVTVADGPLAADLTMAGTIKITGGTFNRLHKLGTGALRLEGDNSGANGLSGTLRIGTAGNSVANSAPGGTVIITNAKALGDNAADSGLQLQFNDGTLQATANLTGANAIPLGISIGAGQLNPAAFTGADMEFTGPVSLFKPAEFGHQIVVSNTTKFSGAFNHVGTLNPSSGVTVSGPGTLILAGPSNAVGEPFIVDGATLEVNGALSATTAAVTVEAGTLKGNGSIAGDAQILSGGFLAPGAGVGTLTFGGDLDVSGAIQSTVSGALKFELGNSSDAVALSAGVLTLGANALNFGDFEFTEGAGFGAGTYTLFSTTQPIDGTLGTGLSGSIGLFTGTISFGDGNTDLILTVVPEPGSAVMLFGGLTVLAMRRRRS